MIGMIESEVTERRSIEATMPDVAQQLVGIGTEIETAQEAAAVASELLAVRHELGDDRIGLQGERMLEGFEAPH